MSLRIRCVGLQIEKLDGRGGRVAVTFRQNADVPPRVFTLLAQRRREAYLSGDRLVWPFTGDPVVATRECLDAFEWAQAEMHRHLAGLGLA
jgi:hypothetical protein